MKFRSIMTSVAGLALMMTPVVAQAADVRVGAPTSDVEAVGGSGFLAMFGFIAAIVALIVIASDGDDEPVSV